MEPRTFRKLKCRCGEEWFSVEPRAQLAYNVLSPGELKLVQGAAYFCVGCEELLVVEQAIRESMGKSSGRSPQGPGPDGGDRGASSGGNGSPILTP